VITKRGKLVFVSESFPLPLARKLTSLILDAQGGGAMQMTSAPQQLVAPSLRRFSGANAGNLSPAPDQPRSSLTADLVRFFGDCGVMKAAVDAEMRAAGH
jgi:hypothetical protein